VAAADFAAADAAAAAACAFPSHGGEQPRVACLPAPSDSRVSAMRFYVKISCNRDLTHHVHGDLGDWSGGCARRIRRHSLGLLVMLCFVISRLVVTEATSA
jgi:hypothetical protein